MCHFLWQAQHLVKFMCWQAQHLVKFMCHFLWQAQYLVKSASGQRESNLGGAAGSVLHFHGRIILGSCSDHSRIMLRSVAHWK